jgi:hypothetical protein
MSRKAYTWWSNLLAQANRRNYVRR